MKPAWKWRCAAALSVVAMLCACTAECAERRRLSRPESVVEHPQTGELYCSNVAGSPKAKDGNGFISLLERTGKVKQLRLLPKVGDSRLHAPKGMCITASGEKGKEQSFILWVTDIDRIVGYDLASLKEHRVINLKSRKAKFVNDLVAIDNKTLCASDTHGDRLFVVDLTGKGSEGVTEIDSGNITGGGKVAKGPNGLALLSTGKGKGRTIVLAQFAGGKGKVWRLRDAAGDFRKLTSRSLPFPSGSWDGVAVLKEKDAEAPTIFASDWKTGAIWMSRKGRKAEIIARGMDGPADFCLLKDGSALIVPVMMESRIEVIALKPVLAK